LPGITTPAAHHQAVEAWRSCSTLPNMTVLETGMPAEVESVLDVMAAVDGPVYIPHVAEASCRGCSLPPSP